jgi:hypothetical protein
MAINYPTSLDTFTNPTATSLLTSPSHAQQHADINDAVEALEAKVAIGNTVLGTYTAYTPTYSSFTLGNGTVTAKYCQVNDFVHVIGSIVFGSTTAITGNLAIGMNFNADAMYYTPTTWVMQMGTATLYDASAGAIYNGVVAGANNATLMQIFSQAANGTYVTRGLVNATTPFTWATGDEIKWNVYFKKA